MGIYGAGLATAIGSAISFVVMLTHFFSRRNTLRLIKPERLALKLHEIASTGFSTFFIDVAMGILTVLFSLYTLFTRYMLSGMPEVICFSLLILFYGLAMSYLKKESRGKLTAMFVISVLLTLMRPYMLLFLALACYFWICRNKKAGWIGSILIVAAT